MDTSAAAQNQVLDEQRFCTRCGYSLYSLRIDGICPECATPVLTSLRDVRQYRAMRRVIGGVTLLAIGWLIGALQATVLPIVIELSLNHPNTPIFWVLSVVVSLSIPLLLGSGLLLVTVRQGREQGNVRGAIWVLMGAYVLMGVAVPLLVSRLLAPAARFTSPLWLWFALAGSLIPLALWACTFVYLTTHLTVPAGRVKSFGWAWLGLLGIATLLSLARYAVVFMGGPQPGARQAMAILGVVLSLASVVAAVVFLLGCRRIAVQRRQSLMDASTALAAHIRTES